jgi:hypothetical protein
MAYQAVAARRRRQRLFYDQSDIVKVDACPRGHHRRYCSWRDSPSAVPRDWGTARLGLVVPVTMVITRSS